MELYGWKNNQSQKSNNLNNLTKTSQKPGEYKALEIRNRKDISNNSNYKLNPKYISSLCSNLSNQKKKNHII